MRKRRYRPGVAARMLPRMVAVLFVVAGVPWYERLRDAPVVAGAVLVACLGMAFVSLRWGRELQIHYRVEGRTLWLGRGRHEVPLSLGQMDSIDWRGPFTDGPRPWPAWILIDSEHHGHRISAWVQDGDLLLEEILAAADDRTLANWAEAKNIERRVQSAGRSVAVSYLLSLVPWIWIWMGWR